MSARSRIIWVSAGLFLFGVFFYLLRAVLSPVFLALALAYIFDPVIDRFEKRKIPRTLAIFIFVVSIVAFIFILILLVAPSLQEEVTGLVNNFPSYTTQLKEKAIPYLERISGNSLPWSFDEIMTNISGYVIKPFAGFVGNILGRTAMLLLSLLNIILIPVFTFYFLRDFDLLKARAFELIPIPYREWSLTRFLKVDEIISAFIRGQLMVCTILAALYSLGLWIIGIDLAMIIGVTAGYLFIVPYLGTVVGIVAASIMALLQYRDLSHLLLVWAVFSVVQLFESYILTPKVVGEKVGLSPVSVIIALLIGGGLFGFLGVVIAVPFAAVIKILMEEFIMLYKSSSIYTGANKQTVTIEEKMP